MITEEEEENEGDDHDWKRWLQYKLFPKGCSWGLLQETFELEANDLIESDSELLATWLEESYWISLGLGFLPL